MKLAQLIFLGVCFVEPVLSAHSLLTVYKSCDPGWGNSSYICDPGNLLSNSSKEKIENSLWELQTQPPCLCFKSEQCYRDPDLPFKSAHIGLLLVVSELPDNYKAETSELYYKLRLNSSCDNGILMVLGHSDGIVYIKRGVISYLALTDEQETAILTKAQSLHSISENDLAIQTLLGDLKSKLMVSNSWSWAPLVGMVFGCVVATVSCAGLVALACNSCGKSKQISYQANLNYQQKQSAKQSTKLQQDDYFSVQNSAEPLYIVSEPTNQMESVYDSRQSLNQAPTEFESICFEQNLPEVGPRETQQRYVCFFEDNKKKTKY